jgi:hypothetical protein
MVNMFSMTGGIGSYGNVYQSLKSKYAFGHPDIGVTPTPHIYPMPVRRTCTNLELPKNFWQRIFKAYYL